MTLGKEPAGTGAEGAAMREDAGRPASAGVLPGARTEVIDSPDDDAQKASARARKEGAATGRQVGRAALLAATLLFVGACASVPPPREELAEARTRVQSAQEAQAGQYAALELRKAQDDLERAERAMAEDRNLEARRRAELAAVQAQLARSRAERAQTEVAVQELERTVQALKEELRQREPMDQEEM